MNIQQSVAIAWVFWYNEASPPLSDLCGGNYDKVSGVQEEYNKVHAQILAKYGKTVKSDFFDKPGDAPRGQKGVVPMGCAVVEGQPKIAVFLHGLMTVFTEIIRQYPGSSHEEIRTAFETSIIIGFMHELLHISFGMVAVQKAKLQKFNLMIGREAFVWGQTCKVMELFLAGGRTLEYSHQLFWDAWIACGKNSYSMQWKAFIRKCYKDTPH